MADFPTGPAFRPFGTTGTLDASAGPIGEMQITNLNGVAAGTWPAANRALYMPIVVEKTITAYQVAISVTTQSGNVDVGIYSEGGSRLVSTGSTAVAAAGVQLFNITDTMLSPGVYHLAMNVDNTTAAFTRAAIAIPMLRMSAMFQQAVGAVTLPSSATFAAVASAYVPWFAVSTVATI